MVHLGVEGLGVGRGGGVGGGVTVLPVGQRRVRLVTVFQGPFKTDF